VPAGGVVVSWDGERGRKYILSVGGTMKGLICGLSEELSGSAEPEVLLFACVGILSVLFS
jgi:hypothetical protein